MRAHAADVIKPTSIKVFRKIHRLLIATPDIQIVGVLTDDEMAVVHCHSLARAVARLFPELEVVDGYYNGSFCHSWLQTIGRDVIDVYPVGSLSQPDGVIAPILVDGIVARELYKERPVRSIQEILTRPWFTPSVDLIETRLRETLATLVSVS